MTRSRLAVTLFAGLLWVTGICGTGAFAENPQAGVDVNDIWATGFAGDSFSAASTDWERFRMLWYKAESGAIPGAAAELTVPTGMSEVWGWPSMYLNRSDATNSIKSTSVGDLSGEMVLGVDAVPTYATEAPLVSAARSITDPVFTLDVQTRTVTLDLTVGPSLAGCNWLQVQLMPPWWDAEDISYSFVSENVPSGFTPGSQPGCYSADDLVALEGNSYQFNVELQVTRTGDLRESEMGHLYHKPSWAVLYGDYTAGPPTVGKVISMDLGSGVEATFTSDVTTNFSGATNVHREVSFDAIVAGVGPAQPSGIRIGKDKRTSLSATTIYNFYVEPVADNIAGGTVTTPDGVPYTMRFDDDDIGGIEFDRETATEGDLNEFRPGSYQVGLTGTDGSTSNRSLDLPNLAFPNEMPVFDQPMGFQTMDRRPTISWQAPNDPNVDEIYFELWSIDDEAYDVGAFLDTAVTSFTPPEDLELGAHLMAVWFCNSQQGSASDGTPYRADFSTGTDSYFNVVPEPATIAFVALGAGGLALRRRRKK